MVLNHEPDVLNEPGMVALMGAAPGTIHAAFLDCIHAYADTVAVACGGESLTYRELDELSTKLAHRLIDLGVTAEARVGICADPSLSLVVAMLGVVKAGGAYVPLDPQYPAERLTYLITDSGAEIIIVQDGLRDRLPVTAARLLVLDPPWTEIAGEPTSRPPAAADASADSVACVIYTSGSTGAPKGVLITHRGVTNLAAAAAAEFGLGPADRFLQLASISFSAILEEIYPALLSGATVVLAGYQRAIPTFTHFLETLKQQRITGFEITTSYWHQLVEELVCGGRLPDTVRFAVMGGDRVEPERVLAWRAFGVPLIHVYGPTETTATATYYHSGKEIPDPAGVLPIGRAIANTEVHLLDETMRPVAEGMAGELYVGGQALARGYHRAPKATATGFVPDPYGLPGGRLYRTGDLARRRPDGTIEFLGRVDGQIKIRGFRIEPGEVESALRRHPDVGKAVVMPAGQASEDKHLVAYVTRRGAATPEVAPLREHLAAILPAYMIPSAFVILDQIPVSAHGKVDHAALAAIEAPAHTAYVTPKPGTESELAALWAEVLKRVRIGADDDFFALGGTSLQAARIVAKARRRLCAELLPADLLKNPTITRLAQRADELLRGHATTYVPLRQQMAPWLAKRQALSRYLSQRTNHQRGSLTSMSQQNLWLMSKLQPNIPLYNESWSCRLRGELDFAAFTHALAKVFDRHEALRTTFELIDGQAVQLVGGPDGLPLSYHDLLDADPLDRLSTAHRLRDTEICRPLDPRREAVRMQLFRLTPTEHLFVMNIHHLVWDAVSKEVFLQEFMAFYQGYGSTQPPDVPDLPVQYGDFALWQRDHLKGANLERLLGYWRDKLADPAAPLPMPSDRPAPPVQDYDGAKLLVSMPGLRRRVHELAGHEGVTPFTVLLTVLYTQLRRRTGCEDLCVGTPVSDRTAPGVESLIGCFINTIPLRVLTAQVLTFRDAMAQVHKTCLEAIENQSLPFDTVVEALRPPRHPGRNPYFQLWFAFEDDAPLPREGSSLALDDFQSMATGLHAGRAKMDLSWLVVDDGDEYRLSLSYRTSMFDDSTARGIAVEYHSLLEELVQNPTASFAQPALSTQELIVSQWRDAFANPEIGVNDDFFELGGYSMLAVQLVTKMQEEFGVEISFTDFFEGPTVAEVAEKVDQALREQPAANHVPAVPTWEEQSLEDILAELETEAALEHGAAQQNGAA